jgi:hypothetical protein
MPLQSVTGDSFTFLYVDNAGDSQDTDLQRNSVAFSAQANYTD